MNGFGQPDNTGLEQMALLAQLLALNRPGDAARMPDPLGQFSGPQPRPLQGMPQFLGPAPQAPPDQAGGNQSMQSMANIASAILPLVLALV
jgi:hypothetical protein